MRLTFCGTGQAYLNPARAGASVAVQHGDAALLLDCGPGSLPRLADACITLDRVRAVLLSHLHFDHTLDVVELLVRLAFAEVEIPPFLGPPGTVRYMEAAVAFARTQLSFLADGLWVPRLDHVDVREAPERPCVVAEMEIEPRTVPHAADISAYAWRVRGDGHTLAYSGDTTPSSEALTTFARDADVLVHEAYTREALDAMRSAMPPARATAVQRAFEATHSEASSVGRVAAAAGVRTLALTHLLPQESEARLRARAAEHFGGAVVVAHDGLGIDV